MMLMTQFSSLDHRKWKWDIVRTVRGPPPEWERKKKGWLGVFKDKARNSHTRPRLGPPPLWRSPPPQTALIKGNPEFQRLYPQTFFSSSPDSFFPPPPMLTPLLAMNLHFPSTSLNPVPKVQLTCPLLQEVSLHLYIVLPACGILRSFLF